MNHWRHTLPAAALLLLAAAGCKPAEQQRAQAPAAPAGPAPGTPEWKIQNAASAAPASIGSAAAIMDWPAAAGGQPTQLRAGTNGWTCFPDMAGTPANDPMCLDGEFLKWAQAWIGHAQPHLGHAAMGYMLQGAADASNTDPFKTRPDSGQAWVITGPHVMMALPNPAGLAGMSTDPNSGGPYVMFGGTPYAHVMMPVAPAAHAM
jgi:hypothetical protein